ncbi:MAG: hypothetical protein A2148_08475 [Chloroflexi bacterium RBG_16_68_14]|nr:MAG: hypothetical protein A2148_08475 [Chloroflexi bacterium RBG_16_68_14]
MTPEQAAAVTSTDQLPAHLRQDAAELLAEFAKAQAAKGHGPESVAADVALVLLQLAFYEPAEVPTLEDIEREARGGWPWETNREKRQALHDDRADGYGRAFLLWHLRVDRERGDEEREAWALDQLAQADEWAAMPPGRRRKQITPEEDDDD